MANAKFHGSEVLVKRLMHSVGLHCDCQPQAMKPVVCTAHIGLLDQRWLDGLLFVYAMRERLLREEGLSRRRKTGPLN